MIVEKKIRILLFQAILFYFILESFSNIMINTNAHIFMNLNRIGTILPTIIIIVIGIILELVIFYKYVNDVRLKIHILIYLVVISRIFVQFLIIPSILMIFNFVLFFNSALVIMELIYLTELRTNEGDFSTLLFGGCLGAAIQLIFLMANISLSLTTDSIKIIPIIIFSGFLLFMNWSIFSPKKLEDLEKGTESMEKEEMKGQEISLVHFIIFGILFLLTLTWIYNPMAISAYDVLDRSYNNLLPNVKLNWISHGFTYYIFLIAAITFIGSYYIHELMNIKSQSFLKKLIFTFIGASFILNLLAIFILETEPIPGVSTFYLTILEIVNIFSLVIYFFYCFIFYSFQNRRKLYHGLVIFFFTNFFFIIIQVQFLWYEYLSLLINNIIILSLIETFLIFLMEGKNLRVNLNRKLLNWNWKKPIKVLYVILFIILIGSFGGILIQRIPESSPREHPIIMTWNIHNAIGVDDVFDPERIAEEIKQNDPDILGLNEVDLGALKTSFVDLTSYFAHHLDMYYFYGYSFYKHYGNALLSKYPISSAEIIHLPQVKESTEPRSMIKAKIEIDNEIWTLFITHLSTDHQDRLVQVPYILSVIEQEKDKSNIIWMGDFNLEPTSEEYQLIKASSMNFIDTARNAGYTCHFDENFIPRKRIDYILCSPDMNAKSSDVYCSMASDHCAVITEFS
ncbi:MAG: endonuclease/exonuclease/phosphatase family protein [Promethearchaeota archaeon]